MQFTCKCLNFLIDATGGVEPVDPSIRHELSSRAQKQELILVTYESITRRIDLLVGMSRQNEWTEFYCRNCSTWIYTYRVRENDSSECKVIVNKSTLITPSEIDQLKEDIRYSPIFKIILFYDINDDCFSGSHEPLHPIAKSWLQEQTELAETRIKNFADQQYAELEKKRLSAFSHQSAIKRAVYTDNQQTSQEPIKRSFVGQSKPVKSAAKAPKPESSTPVDNFFEMDESMFFESKSSSDSVIFEGSDEDIIDLPEPRRTVEPMAIARSLPIPVPQFLEERRHDDRHDKSPQTPNDIAANIKALARSVHGNPIFGDLPRPRFTKD